MSLLIPNGNSLNKEDDCYVIIKGMTTDGKKFRPSDWCDRLYSTLRALTPEDYEDCISYVHLVNYDGNKCILVDSSLKKTNAMLYKFFMGFMDNNDLAKTVISKEKWNAVNSA